ncbi:hypothetical protein BDZ97DRAFT_1818947 [Flammula alnicola]|nr:hypothetical protein BDZ97DRAFT_1818947 [Flammula alnicola]
MKIRDSQDRWRRDGLPSGLTKHTLLQLPIWEAFVNRCKRLQPASDLQVLPSHFSETDLLPYQAPNIAIAALSHSLPEFMRYCRNKTFAYMTSQRIMDVVQLPRTVSGPDIGTYKKFVKSMLRFPVAEIRTVGIRVPDEMGELRPVSQLYDHTMRLFSQTLKFTERSSFIHSQFRDLLTSIRDVGLVHTITFDTFVSCAKAVEVALNPHTQAGTRVDRQSLLEMSDMAFDTYQGSLPALIMLNEALWRVLDNISFVRRKGIRRHGASYVSPERYCSEGALSIVLPPSKFVRQNLEPVVWTQRALFFNEPTAEVLTVNNKLGVPSAGEVVEHLKVLTTQIGHDHPGNLSLLSDIKATYKWLNEHSQEAQEALLLAHDLSIFLNVNDPMTDAWDGQWATAEQLVLDLRYDHKPYKCVRLFLQEYDNLLRAAGSGTLKLFKREAEEGDTSDLGAIRYRESRKAFNEMRKAGKLTDVTFKPSYTGEDDLTVGVADLRAHRIFLAAMIPHFRDSANWMEEPIPFYGTSFGAKTLLDFIYTGEFVLPTIDLESDEELAKLMRDFLELLPIADQWDMPDLKEKIEWSMIHKYDMLQSLPHAHQIMRKVAVECKAQKLEAALDDLTRDNGMLLQHFQD